MSLRWNDFEVEGHRTCNYDAVTIETGSGDVLGPYCDRNQPPTVETFQGPATIVFQTDSSRTYQGFSVEYSNPDAQGRIDSQLSHQVQTLYIDLFVE